MFPTIYLRRIENQCWQIKKFRNTIIVMKRIALASATLVGSFGAFAQGATELETLRSRCSEQERQIVQLESKVDKLNSIIELNQRKTMTSTKVNTAPIEAANKSTSAYTVQKGDTISKIAKTHKVSAQAIVTANKLENAGMIAIGQKLTIPNTTPAKVAETPKSAPKAKSSPVISATETKGTKASNTSVATYKVKSGDTLYRISRNSGISVSNLLKANPGIKADRLAVGQTIKLAQSSTATTSKSSSKKVAAAQKQIAKAKPQVASSPAPVKQPNAQPIAKAKEKTVTNTPKVTSVRAVKVDKQMTFGEFCSAHGVTVDQVNELNGHALTKSQYLARGSELYVPSNQH